MKPVNQNPDRYSISADSKQWIISSSPSVPPLIFNFGSPLLNIIPVLESDGIVVRVSDVHLVSPNTLIEIESSLNPHYDIEQNGSVLNRPMGKTIPIITLDVIPLTNLADGRNVSNSIAGVTDVVYGYEDTEKIQDLPLSLIQQINWTLTDSDIKPFDSYSFYDFYTLVQKPEYSIEPLNVETAQADGRLDKEKLKTFVVSIAKRLEVLRADFNTIKAVFFDGSKVASLNIISQTKVATVFETDSELVNSFTRVKKESTIIDIVSTPATDALSGDLTAGIQSQVQFLSSGLSSLSNTVSKLPSTTTTPPTTGSRG
jgi:hypothetical protein